MYNYVKLDEFSQQLTKYLHVFILISSKIIQNKKFLEGQVEIQL